MRKSWNETHHIRDTNCGQKVVKVSIYGSPTYLSYNRGSQNEFEKTKKCYETYASFLLTTTAIHIEKRVDCETIEATKSVSM